MKLDSTSSKTRTPRVAPRAGAWIETPSGFRVIKHRQVAPRAGAWIETSARKPGKEKHYVAPRAGAWIETTIAWKQQITKGRPPRGGVD